MAKITKLSRCKITECTGKTKPPKVVELRILLLHEPKPTKEGFWKFVPVLPNEGTCNMRIYAKTPEAAKGLLEGWLINELTDDIDDLCMQKEE